MNDKSSTTLAMISVLTILIVLFIAISNVSESPVRRPFPSVGAGNDLSQPKEDSTTAPAFINSAENKVDDQFEQNFPEFVNSISGNETVQLDAVSNTIDLPEKDLPRWEAPSPSTDSLTYGITSQVLTKAGFTNFVIKPIPFNGVLFERFSVPMLSYLNIVDKRIIQVRNGNETEVLRVYQFNFDDSEGAKEIYDFLKTDLKGELGVDINENNQFGLSSFFINLQEPGEMAFLVVKTKTNVYALSYPKSNGEDENYFSLVSSLLSDII